jgi:hypothetical protein
MRAQPIRPESQGMTIALTLVRLFPAAFLGRLATAFVEIVVAAAILSSSVVIGHQLHAWRDWYGAPGIAHPWAPTPVPSAAPEAASN